MMDVRTQKEMQRRSLLNEFESIENELKRINVYLSTPAGNDDSKYVRMIRGKRIYLEIRLDALRESYSRKYGELPEKTG
ncbi:TPA: hypothetical protein DCG86_09160 [Candidatus Marinimicrobia bacterium]|nr:hypothetical protein [Candidatus Neomarinimicrobiota bacterium]